MAVFEGKLANLVSFVVQIRDLIGLYLENGKDIRPQTYNDKH